MTGKGHHPIPVFDFSTIGRGNAARGPYMGQDTRPILIDHEQDPMTQTAPDDLRRIPPIQPGPLGAIQRLLESARFQQAIIALIALNAITLGLETSARVMQAIGPLLMMLDTVLLTVFVAELVLKLVVYRSRFARDPWNLFDFAVIAVALIPATGSLSALRALRILRVLRLISAVPSMRRVVGALIASIPGIGSIVGLLSLVFYVFAVIATKLFGASFPEFFGTLGASLYTLFQVMTLESWSMGVVRPVMEVYPLSWAYFLPFILLTSFTVLNLFIGIVVDAIQRQHEAEAADDPQPDLQDVMTELRALRAEVQSLRKG
ncbi:voltage-gated sodium channel [Thalassovita litoralis]|uniref:Voltage-gated sodium channel n=2 Tax=Thalassovita litoralis TaxID=1010611 RepID=A0A521DD22_9RHOB|nr:voltage-gated sodium channel [Thalassovita litoralis]